MYIYIYIYIYICIMASWNVDRSEFIKSRLLFPITSQLSMIPSIRALCKSWRTVAKIISSRVVMHWLTESSSLSLRWHLFSTQKGSWINNDGRIDTNEAAHIIVKIVKIKKGGTAGA
jgi:hypothetical protein